MAEDGFFYIVVEIRGNKYFVNNDCGFSEKFNNVKEFPSEEQANDFIERNMPDTINSKILKL